ncbi:hypothetical protein SAY87_029632 [Trapa incisa]|uniref:Cyclin-dependent protein kinase inhibitor SMR1 n=1 Tax=Trapa incisa TaxID=236973 RepID=A0AAN7Q979_9MYRT|nr:hypothetical protein SAY87_029632 [Trapa incisa]
MSTNIQLFRYLPKLRLHPIDPTPPSESPPASFISMTEATGNSDAVHPDVDSRDECRTPTSEESRIPAVLGCPLAPKKPRPAFYGKRKLSEQDSLGSLHRGEIEEFFRLASARIAIEAPKRRRFSKRIVP